MAVALTLTVVAPVWLLLFAPLLLGVPHIFADIRYLILRPPTRVERIAMLGVITPLVGMTIFRVLFIAGVLSVPRIEVLFGILSLSAAVVLARGRTRLQLALVAAIAGITMIGMVSLGMAHLHNFVAFALWVAWSRSSGASKRCTWAVGGMFLGGVVLLASGLLDPFVSMIGGLGAVGGLTLGEMTHALAPGLPGSKAFEPRESPTTFCRDMRSLLVDFGPTGLGIAIGLTLLVPLLGFLNPSGTRESGPVRSNYLFTHSVFHAREPGSSGPFFCSIWQPIRASGLSPQKCSPSKAGSTSVNFLSGSPRD